MHTVTLDFETYSELDVREVGAEVYAQHPSTDIICMAYSIDDAEPSVWQPGDPFPADLATVLGASGYELEAHNVAFERAIWGHVGVKKYGFPPISDEQWRCTQAMCARKGIALKLEKGGEMLGLDQQKDMAGKAAMEYLSKPRVTKTKGIERRYDFARLEACMDYCAQDVRTEIAIRRRVGHLEPEELKVWQLDQTINRRGVLIDQELCHAAIDVASQVEGRMVREFEEITGGLKPTQRDKVLGWMEGQGVALPDLTAETVAWVLSTDCYKPVTGEVRRALEIRQALARSSVKKYQKALATTCPDGRSRGLLQYYGAATGRWAGRLWQPQNLPRPSNEKLDMEALCWLIKRRDAGAIEALYGDVMTALADATRGIIIPSPGHVLAAYDFSSIEAIVLACMFGEEWKIEAFRRKECAYCLAAETIFGHKVTKAEHPDKRQVGKTCELAFGYQGGVGAWRNFDASDRHTDEDVDRYKKAWRAKHQRVVDGWHGLDRAALAAVTTGRPHDYAGFEYALEDGWLTCRMLSGRKLYYYDPRIEMATMPWTDDEGYLVKRPTVEFLAWKEGQIKRVRGYGGHWTENVDQALSRDIMVGAMFRMEAAGFPVILTIHDEVVAEIPERDADRAAKEIPELMAERLPWMQTHGGWPIRAEGDILTRYRK